MLEISGVDNSVTEFEALLEQGNVSEQDCQEFLENNTEFLYTPFLLNHWIHFGSIISKFPLDTSLITDFAYLTKSSDFWHLVLVELEHPYKRLFRRSGGNIIPTAELTAAIAQIHSWQDFIRRNSNEVLRRLNKFRVPLGNNPVRFKYFLIIGRGEEKSGNQEMRDRLVSLGNEDFLIGTYDSLISAYQEGPKIKKNILRLTRTSFELKYLHRDMGNLLAYLKPDDLVIGHEFRQILAGMGYEMDNWEQGQLLIVNGMRVNL
jgi:hypothetical protein